MTKKLESVDQRQPPAVIDIIPENVQADSPLQNYYKSTLCKEVSPSSETTKERRRWNKDVVCMLFLCLAALN